ncbi:MAG: tetratricopeptide repeat protein, partial [Candidatus Sulfotelmatobacter sp.]
SGTLSALDLEAPNKAVQEYNQANSLMKAQHSKEAIKHLQRAIKAYPKFVSAHISLGLGLMSIRKIRRSRGRNSKPLQS